MRYWLMKSEPSDYSINDLERDGRQMWDGCRNYQVRNYMRDEMNRGDLAIFYHSSAEPSGAAGVMRIVGEPYPDPTQFDPKNKHYDPKSLFESPKWILRDVEFVSKFSRVISIKELRVTPGLENLKAIQKGQRLSVTPVTQNEWKIIHKLAENL